MNFTTKLLALPRSTKRKLVVAADLFVAWLALWLAFTLRLEVWHVPSLEQLWIYVAVPLIFVPVFARFGLYRAIFRYADLEAIRTLLKATVFYGVLLHALVLVTFPAGVPRSVAALQPIIFLVFASNLRVWGRLWLNKRMPRESRHRLLIYGAGSAGAQTAAAVTNADEFDLLGFIDDDVAKVGRHINGVPVFSASDVGSIVDRLEVSDILLALPSSSRRRRRQIIEGLRSIPVHIRTLPGIADLAFGRVTLSDFRELDVEDLLGRDPVPPNSVLLARDLAEKVVLVTGAGGSIGSELCRQILGEGPARLLLLDHNEFGLYAIHEELVSLVQARLRSREGGECRVTNIVPLLGSVRDYQRMADICQAYKPDTVYHAAAYKHVPMVECNPCEGVSNNVFGTLNAAKAAIGSGVRRFVLVSTDKAVRPTNVMGASKRAAELILQALSPLNVVRWDEGTSPAGLVLNRTRFTIVRFGNVLGSSGSVVPLFRKQIENGGPITLTHPEVTRFFMTIPEAGQLVLQAGAMGEGGEVFVLDMGNPVKIVELARRMVELSGRTIKDESHPDGEIEIEVIGLRPGEKLYEELLIGDNPSSTVHPRILKAREEFIPWDELRQWLSQLDRSLRDADVFAVCDSLERVVAGYRLASEPLDAPATASRM
jgi:FlaA1/EpsC-like NDP-sugar epimerase